MKTDETKLGFINRKETFGGYYSTENQRSNSEMIYIVIVLFSFSYAFNKWAYKWFNYLGKMTG